MATTDVLELLLVSESTSEPWPITLYNPITGATVWSYKGTELQSECISDVAIISNEYALISTAKRPVAYLVGFESKRTVNRSFLPWPVHCLATSSDGGLCCGSVNEKLYTWILSSGQLMSVVSSHYQPIEKISFTTDNCYVITAGKDGCIVVWNVGDLVTPLDNTIVKSSPIYKWSVHSLPITDLKVGHGGIAGRVYTVSLDQTAKIHSLTSGDLLMTLFFDCPLTSCDVDNAETRLFVGTAKGDVRQTDMFVEPVTRERHVDLALDLDEQVLKGHKQKVNSLSVNVDGSLLATASEDGDVKIWHIISRQCVRTINCKGQATKIQFISTPPAIVNPDYVPRTLVQCLQKNVATHCEEIVFARLIDRGAQNATENLEFLLDHLLEEEMRESNEPCNEVNDPEYLRNELAKAKQVNKNLYQFCVDKIISGT